MASKRSLDQDGEITNHLMCSPCSKRGNRVKAVKFCEDCLEYLCSGCVHDHNKFGIMNGHTFLNDIEMWSLRKYPCKFHPRNMIDRYCWYHDAICCSKCESTNHSYCIGVEYLPTVAKKMKTSDRYKNIMSTMQNMKFKLSQTKKEQEEELERLEHVKDSAICNIQETTNKMIKHLTDLEKKKIEELCSRYQIQEDKTKENINELGASIESVEENIKQIETSGEDTEQFLVVNSWKNIKESCQKQIKTNQDTVKRIIKFKANDIMTEVISNVNSLGELTEEDVGIEYLLTHHGDYTMKLENDMLPCIIGGLCQMGDGTIIVADRFNNKLKRFDGRYDVRDHCDLPERPHGVCTVGRKQVAVALNNKVQFVTIGKTMTLSRSFNVDCRCTGICYMADRIYVSVNGDDDHVRMYDKKGQMAVLGTFLFYTSVGEKVWQIAASTNNITLFAVNNRGRLDRVNMYTDSFNSIRILNSMNVLGVCEGPNGQLFVADFDNTIFSVNSYGENQKLLLRLKDDIHSIFYDKTNSRLIVSLETDDTIKVYNLPKTK